jgi:hypothetical protein
MARKTTALVDLDIESEGLTHQDGLAERLAKQRARHSVDAPPEVAPGRPAAETQRSLRQHDPNAWRRGKSLVQVAIPEDAHIELSVIAKRRRTTLSKIVKAALNDWLASHGHQLHLPD